MKLRTEQLHNVESNWDFTTYQSKINKNKLKKLYMMLSSLYRNPIGAIVKEYTSNGYDANKEAYAFKTKTLEELKVLYPWVDDPVFEFTEISLKTLKDNLKDADENAPVVVGVGDDENGQAMFHVKDYGIGLSPQRMINIFFDYLSSTKEDTDGEIGGFGIGAKSALAYTHTFFITTNYNGMRYEYIMTKNQEGYPEGKLLLKVETDKKNGTLIKVPIKNSDVHLFVSEICSKLAYIPNVYYEGKLHANWQAHNCDFNESSKIYGNDLWMYSALKRSDPIHISLENISYDIDWSELSIPQIPVPLAIRFNTGELTPTPSRESIVYTKESIALIEEKILQIQTWFSNKYVSETKPTNDFVDYVISSRKKKDTVNIGGVYDVNMFSLLGDNWFRGIRSAKHYAPAYYIKKKYFEPKVYRKEPTPIAKAAFAVRAHWEGKTYLNDGRTVSAYYNREMVTGITDFLLNFSDQDVRDKKKLFLYLEQGEVITDLKIHYALSKHPDLIKLYKDDPYGSIRVYRRRKVKLEWFIKNTLIDEIDAKGWREYLNATTGEANRLFEELGVNISSLNPDPNWIKSYYAGKTRFRNPSARKDKTVFNLRFIHDYQRRSPIGMRAVDIAKIPYLIYALKEDIDCLLAFQRMLSTNNRSYVGKNTYRCAVINKSDIKKISEMDNTYTLEEFIGEEMNSKLIKRHATKAMCYSYHHYLNGEVGNMFYLSDDLRARWNKLCQYGTIDGTTAKGSFINRLISAVANKYDLYDKDIINEYKMFMRLYRELPELYGTHNYDNPSSQWHLARKLRRLGVRINEEFYTSHTTFLYNYVDSEAGLVWYYSQPPFVEEIPLYELLNCNDYENNSRRLIALV